MANAPDILLVEDDPNMLEVMVEALSMSGYECAAAMNGNEALSRLKGLRSAPRLILSDLLMPDLDGWQLLRVVRADLRLGAIPVVICSNHPDAAQDVVRLGADEFLAKPVTIEQLLSVAARFVGPRSAHGG